MSEPVRWTAVDGPHQGRVLENDHPHLLLHANETVRWSGGDTTRRCEARYRLNEDGTATWQQ